jgi:mono/diheme cytochrome c family protein
MLKVDTYWGLQLYWRSRRRRRRRRRSSGSYLVNGLQTCGNCHTPRGCLSAFAMDRQLGRSSGGPADLQGEGANITPDKETGIGN